jgi:hypothetical protein
MHIISNINNRTTSALDVWRRQNVDDIDGYQRSDFIMDGFQ